MSRYDVIEKYLMVHFFMNRSRGGAALIILWLFNSFSHLKGNCSMSFTKKKTRYRYNFAFWKLNRIKLKIEDVLFVDKWTGHTIICSERAYFKLIMWRQVVTILICKAIVLFMYCLQQCLLSWTPFTKGCFVPSLVEIGLEVLEKKIFRSCQCTCVFTMPLFMSMEHKI